MKMLLLDGHGIDMRVNSAKLHIKNGRTILTEEPEEYYRLRQLTMKECMFVFHVGITNMTKVITSCKQLQISLQEKTKSTAIQSIFMF